MAEPLPIHSQSDLVQSEAPLPEQQFSSLDEVIERCLGSFGWNQFFQALLVSFAWFFDSQQAFISVFTEAAPAWHCTHLDATESCNSGVKKCQLPKTSWARDFPVDRSLISEWDLACVGPFISGLPTSSFFIGCLMGGLLLATLADSSLGRKNLLVLSCLIMSLAGTATAFSPNIWVYSALRYISGFGRATIGTCALVLSTELVGKKWRGEVGIIGFFTFAFGFLLLPVIAYLNKGSSWRRLYLWTSIPAVLYSILLHFTIHESPRWLFVQGRKEEAIKVLKSMSNNRSFSISDNSLSSVSIDKETWNVDLYSGIKILWTQKWAFRRLCCVMIVGFGTGMVYYGMPLSLGNINFNLYLSVGLNALSELPASFITLFLVGKMNRKSAVLVFTVVSGVCGIICVVVAKKEVRVGMELVSFFSASTAFNVLLIYTLELFPTSIRNSALSLVRQSLILAGVFAPMLVAAGREHRFLSNGVFGLVIGCSGFFVVPLPETRGGSFCDTMDEQKHKEIKASVTPSAASSDNGV